mmetsp:Transcript_73416/g.195106  ORF Transcript_73416/g.195106 Transcript_73416/m.195106 type:complete len:152 (-) Transcript_73416:87-542(-)
MKDEDVIRFLRAASHDVRTLIVLVLAVVILIALNIRTWRRKKSLQKEADKYQVKMSAETMAELELEFPIPPGVKSKDFECRITSQGVKFGIKGDKSFQFERKLGRRVLPDECTWQLEPVGGEPTCVKLTLVKASQGHWPTLFDEEASKKDN